MKIVAVGHKKSRGKDTLCNFMLNHLQINCDGCTVRKVGFADKLKDVAYQLYGWAGLHRGVYYETHYNEKEIVLPAIGQTPRDLWIGVGNKMREVYGPTWIHYITKTDQGVDVLLIKDLGYRNEGYAVREAGGVLIRIDREGPLDDDPRETELDDWSDWDAIVCNHGSLPDLHAQAVTLCEDYIL